MPCCGTLQFHNVVTLLGRKTTPGNQCEKVRVYKNLCFASWDTSKNCTPLPSTIQDPIYDFPFPIQDPTCYCLSTVMELIYNPHQLHKILFMTVHLLYWTLPVTCHPLYPILLTTVCPYIVSDHIYECPHTEPNPTHDTLSTVQGPSCDFHFPVQNKMQS